MHELEHIQFVHMSPFAWIYIAIKESTFPQLFAFNFIYLYEFAGELWDENFLCKLSNNLKIKTLTNFMSLNSNPILILVHRYGLLMFNEILYETEIMGSKFT